jgi:hypothetical protein
MLPTRADMAGTHTAHAPETEHVDEWPCRICGRCNTPYMVNAGIVFLEVDDGTGAYAVVRVERHNDGFPAHFTCQRSTREAAEIEVAHALAQKGGAS